MAFRIKIKDEELLKNYHPGIAIDKIFGAQILRPFSFTHSAIVYMVLGYWCSLLLPFDKFAHPTANIATRSFKAIWHLSRQKSHLFQCNQPNKS